ncbi:MAG: mechanosensitive ion channel family protein [Candidatus Omnitrophica bacterium]|nr:mechanosensitive ion channel family protein [Candidatus Omnitrophota bacterium]MBU1366355.1 mechanosensitive ion channel family protein [Candidatus Omnitrophota bacterium]MBU1523296.1 mechanosensitive ion channel family protein [Candidatus Omnitrophota bacterium]MBU1809830.1 mechanosensitive ion channel family protein [Candidatus Omnitrophota bacterium]MBU2437079.1 mechanosensitive ion channel family protein [Candidatus Omnitrophota bacterium]
MMGSITEQMFLGNRLLDYIIFLLIFLGALIVIKIFRGIVLKRLKKLAEKTVTTIDDFLISTLERIVLPLLYFGAFYLAVNSLALNLLLNKIINVLGVAVLTLFTARLITEIIGYGFKFYWSGRSKDASLERSLKGILGVVKVIVWGLAIVFFLDNLGFKISSVIAGLGIGGVAVALAAQAVLKDLFSYFSIIFDRPFEVGDFIIVGEYLGAVEYIGIKTTRIRSLGGEQLIFSNTDLTDSRVRNYKRMEKRRVVFRLGVTYQTPQDKLKQIPKIVENIIKNVKDTMFDRAHFFSYGDFSLIFEVVYYVLGSDYNKYMDTQQEINFGLKEELEKQGVEFAYPTQTIYVNKTD